MTAENTAPRHTTLTDWIWLSLPYVLLVATSGYMLVTGTVSRDDAPLVIVASVTLALWHTFWAVLNRQWLEHSLAPMAVYYLGLIGLCTWLLETSLSFFTLYLVCYPMAFVALPGVWAYVGLAIAALSSLIPVTQTRSGVDLAITGAGLTLAAFAGWSIRRLEAETAARKAALLELTTAHTQLEHALAENIALQDRLVSEAHETGVATERARLAAEIHDTLAAALSGIVSQLEALDAEVGLDDSVRPRLRASTELARESLREARHSIQALRPSTFNGRSLESAMADTIGGFERTHHLAVRWHVTGDPLDLGTAVEDALVRIAREALTNVGRHAGARQVYVTLSYFEEAAALDVADDGAGFDAAAPSQGGHGLSIMSERIRALGGDLDLRTAPGTGTTLTATVPISPSREGEARYAAGGTAPRSDASTSGPIPALIPAKTTQENTHEHD